MNNTFFYLIGPPGVGKYTVGKIIAARTGAKLVDNHYSINPILARGRALSRASMVRRRDGLPGQARQ